MDRAKVLKVNDFGMFSRLKASKVKMREATFKSNQIGMRESKELVGKSNENHYLCCIIGSTAPIISLETFNN